MDYMRREAREDCPVPGCDARLHTNCVLPHIREVHGAGGWAISAAAEGKGYSERTKGKRGHTEGPPHPHIWNSLIIATAKDPQLEPNDRDQLNAYAQEWRVKGPLALCDEIRCCRTKKCFDTKYLNLFVRVREGTQSATVWGIIKKRMVLSGSILREGLAPQSNMEREIEKFLELFKSR